MSSIGGIANVPGSTVNASTKSGLSHFSGGLRMDLKGTTIGLALVEPGPVDTKRGLGLYILEDLPRRAVAACLVGVPVRS